MVSDANPVSYAKLNLCHAIVIGINHQCPNILTRIVFKRASTLENTENHRLPFNG
jgi:hypothetical protein